MIIKAVALAAAFLGVVSGGVRQVPEPEFPYPVTNYQEDNRGQFHFSSRGGWMNDVNAPLYYRGVYHLYYQHNPHGLAWDTMHWGHATSTDLVHWQQKPIALEPGVHPGDLWSGGGVVDTRNVTGLKAGDDDPIVVYSGTNGVTVFYSLDGGNTFSTFADGKKVVVPPAKTSRDPKVFWDPDAQRWGMVVWTDQGGNGADFYTSANLLDWTFASRYQADWLFECPDMVRMPYEGGHRWVLSDGGGEYVVGSFTDGTFRTTQPVPQKINQTDTYAGAGYYAALTFENLPTDRVVSMAWQGQNQGTSWTGNASFPVEQRLRSTGGQPRVVSTPVPEIAGLRESTRSWVGRTLDKDSAKRLLAGVQADTYEIEASVDVRQARSVGFRLHTSPDGWSDRDVVYDVAKGTLDGTPLRAEGGRVKLRLLVDRGQLEVFGNDGEVYQSRNVNFDSLPGGDGVELVVDGKVRLESLKIHDLSSIWKRPGESTLKTNIAGDWYPASGNWTDATGGKQGQASGDAFYLSKASGSDFTLEGDVRLVSGTAAALTFRASKDASRHYTVNIDADAGVVKLWRPGRDIAAFPAPIERNRTYHLKVKAVGSQFTVWLDGQQVISASDGEIASGQFGLNVFRGTAVLQNVRRS
ncbi:GH32 C-terminal domain-containing protein [Kribbella italica]|uniref:Sucrose-6-phosphate hydrolase SacC (GH32 family) n=1 Tax=Kribbella italica TaxID=1540520 RepID=A0A7W9J267_9ACTN|nr:glycoside hydrolase family 32 protein [Kribbella italica]MBB5834005.1 sucrose-6-phosphate hydrolase SacC (GH32 family) [Kribbella italica]